MVIINDFDVTIGNRLKMYVFYAMNIKTMQIRAYTTWPQLMWDQVGFQQGEMFVCGLGSYLAELQLHISVHNLCGQTTHCRRGPMIFGKLVSRFHSEHLRQHASMIQRMQLIRAYKSICIFKGATTCAPQPKSLSSGCLAR